MKLKIIALILMVIFVVACTPPDKAEENLAGEAYRGEDTASTNDECLLHMNEKSVFLTDSDSACRDLYIGVKYTINRRDIHRLLTFLGHDVDRDSVLDKANELSVSWNGKAYSDIEAKIDSTGCENIEYLDINLRCFNRDSFEFVVSYLSVLKYLSSEPLNNAMLDREISPFNVVAETYEYICDGSGECPGFNLERPCKEGFAAVNSKADSNSSAKMKLCSKMLNKDNFKEKKLHYVSVLYHEANHNLDELSHNYENHDIMGHMRCPFGEVDEEGDVKEGDADWATVFGEQISFLFMMSEHPALSCQEQGYAFDRAEWEMENHMCEGSKGQTVKHSFTKHECAPPEQWSADK